MKKVIILIFLLFSITLFSCNNEESPKDYTLTVSLDDTNTNSKDLSFTENSIILEESLNELVFSTIPSKDGYEFNWYLDENLNNLVQFPYTITNNERFYFGWNLNSMYQVNYSSTGYVTDSFVDYTQYENTSQYRKVSTASEFIDAIIDAKYHYKNVWDDNTNTYTQLPADGYNQDNMIGSVKVIEVLNDINLGYNLLTNEEKNSGVVDDFCRNKQTTIAAVTMSDMYLENGISQIKIENTSNLLIFSKNGSKLTHCGFKLTSCDKVAIRNLEFDEIWQWEDSSNPSTGVILGDYDAFGWAYFKISFCGKIWIDHCTFGKSYDGQIDYSNPDYTANSGVAFRAPYGADGSNGLHISWCNFNAGSDDKDGYLYKMMAKIENEYQQGKTNYLYYNALRDAGISFEQILYGIAIPQKKGFLCGDSGDNKNDYQYNLKLNISFANCIFKNIEDRLPKLRGGNAYMYNCVVDSSQYYQYRAELLKLNAKTAVQKVNSKWKCALVSQGIICSNGGSVQAENCIFRGIQDLLKNNESTSALTSTQKRGGYNLVDCSYQLTQTSTIVTNNFPNSSIGTLKKEYFSWHTADGLAPFEIEKVELANLEAFLQRENYGVGTHSNFFDSFLKSNYR